jgi:hypothetical protein
LRLGVCLMSWQKDADAIGRTNPDGRWLGSRRDI